MSKIQPTIWQRKNECSLSVLCILNGYSQATYEMISNKIRNEGLTFIGTSKELGLAINRGIQLVRQLGKIVPEGYGTWATNPGDADNKLEGKGIIYLSLYLPRKRKATNCHVVCFDNGKVIDTKQDTYPSWAAYVAAMKAKGWGRVTIQKVYPA